YVSRIVDMRSEKLDLLVTRSVHSCAVHMHVRLDLLLFAGGSALQASESEFLRIRGACHFFFFQAEDGIRDWSVTGVQTCALPISIRIFGCIKCSIEHAERVRPLFDRAFYAAEYPDCPASPEVALVDYVCRKELRSEERRVGKECRSRGWPQEQEERRVQRV